MLPFRYLFREGLSGVRRTPVASAVTILTIVTALVLVGVFWYTSLNLDALVSSMRKQVELEAFILPQAGVTTDALRAQVLGIPGVDSVHYISSPDAAKLFESQTGEHVTALLDSNPFPSSFRIALRQGYTAGSAVERIAQSIEGLTGIDTVMYRQELVNRIDTIAETTRRIGTIGGGIILFIALILTANTIRLAIFAKRNLIRTLHLVGATRTFIRLPFILEGIVHGLLGAAIATGVLYGCVMIAQRTMPEAQILVPPLPFYAGIALAGMALGFVGSVISTMRFLARAR